MTILKAIVLGIVAVLIFFRQDIVRLVRAALRGAVNPKARAGADWRLACAVVAGSVPIGIVGLGAKGAIEGPLRSLGVVGAALVLWSAVLIHAERRARQDRGEETLRVADAVRIGLVQCVALVPGVSVGGEDQRWAAAWLRPGDGHPARVLPLDPRADGGGDPRTPSALGGGVGAGPTLVAFVIAYASVAWLLRFVAGHSVAALVPYRVAVGLVVLGAVALGW